MYLLNIGSIFDAFYQRLFSSLVPSAAAIVVFVITIALVFQGGQIILNAISGNPKYVAHVVAVVIVISLLLVLALSTFDVIQWVVGVVSDQGYIYPRNQLRIR